MFKALGSDRLKDKKKEHHTAEVYANFCKFFKDTYDSDISKVNVPEIEDKLFEFLSPYNFGLLMAGEKSTRDMNLGAQVIPLPMSIAVLRRVKGTVITVCGKKVVIGGNIPQYHFTTIELRMGAYQRQMYTGTHEMIKADTKDLPAGKKPAGDDDEEIPSMQTSPSSRRKVLASAAPRQDTFSQRKVDIDAPSVHALYVFLSQPNPKPT